jgi:O-antigen ligase
MFLSLVFSFARGDLFTVFMISVIYIVVFSKQVVQIFIQAFTLATLLVAFYLVFGSTLRAKGYDPVEKIVETVTFALDVDNPDWDKGRSLSRAYATDSWNKHVWTGVGYDALYNHGGDLEIGTAHNFIITSLFHRGIIGTSIYLLIVVLLFRNSIKLWFLLRRENSYENDMYKLLIISSFFWLVPFWNQEVIWEKYSLSIEFIYLGIITNVYLQKRKQQAETLKATRLQRYRPNTPVVHN